MIELWKPIQVKEKFINFCLVNKNVDIFSKWNRYIVIDFDEETNKYYFLKSGHINAINKKYLNKYVLIFLEMFDDWLENYYINCSYIFTIDKNILEKIVNFDDKYYKKINILDNFCIHKILDNFNKNIFNIKVLDINDNFDINLCESNKICEKFLKRYNLN